MVQTDAESGFPLVNVIPLKRLSLAHTDLREISFLEVAFILEPILILNEECVQAEIFEINSGMGSNSC